MKSSEKPQWTWRHTVASVLTLVSFTAFIFVASASGSTINRVETKNLDVAQLVVVDNASYILTQTGEVYSEGLNNFGQLGDGTLTNRDSWTLVTFPVAEGQPKPILTKLASYGEHVIALDDTGSIWLWGDSESFALGDGTDTSRTVPSKLTVSYSFDKFAVGDDFALAIDTSGALYSWGANGSGQLGTGDTKAVALPSWIAQETRFKAVTAGSDFVLAIDVNGGLWAWGNNDSGQFGNGNKESSSTPQQVSGGSWSSIYASSHVDTVLGIGAGGQLYSWGPNADALLGNGRDWRAEQVAENKRVADQKAEIKAADDARRQALIETASLAKLSEINAEIAQQHATWETARNTWVTANPEPVATDPLFLTPEEFTTAHKLWETSRDAWITANPEPLPRDTLTAAETKAIIDAVDKDFVFTDTSGIVAATIIEPKIGAESLTPVEIAGDKDFVSASLGSENAFAIDSNGGLWSWGNDANGQTGLGLDEKTHTHAPVRIGGDRFSSVYAGPTWAVASGASGGLFTWGLNDASNRLQSGEAKLASLTKISDEAFESVAGGTSTGAAVRSDGTAYSWGKNSSGLSGQGSADAKTNLAALPGSYRTIDFSKDSGLALSKGSGYLYFWGAPSQLAGSGEVPAAAILAPERQALVQFTDVAAGRLSTHVVDTNGFVWTWGLSWMGALSGPATTIHQPTRVPLDEKVVSVAANQTNVLVLTESGRILWWGSNTEGFQVTEAKVAEDQGTMGKVVKIAAGERQFTILDDAGAVWQFASNYTIAQHSLPPTALFQVELPGKATDVGAGGETSMAIVDGTLYGWGDNSAGQLSPDKLALGIFMEPTEMLEAPVGAWAKIGVSSTHALAVTDAGALYGWGESKYMGKLASNVTGLPVQLTVKVEVQ